MENTVSQTTTTATNPAPGKILPIMKYGQPVLRAKGRPITRVDDETRQLAADMLETMRDAQGLGLAAQQVGVAAQLTVIDVSPIDREERPSALFIGGEEAELDAWMPLVLLNPQVETGRRRPRNRQRRLPQLSRHPCGHPARRAGAGAGAAFERERRSRAARF